MLSYAVISHWLFSYLTDRLHNLPTSNTRNARPNLCFNSTIYTSTSIFLACIQCVVDPYKSQMPQLPEWSKAYFIAT